MKKRAVLFLLIIMIFSCGKISFNKNKIELPKTKMPENINEYAVVKYKYSRLREEPLEESKVINYIPEGKIVKVFKRDNNIVKFDNISHYWYYIDYNGEKGWVFGSFLEIFNDYNEAFKKSEEILLNKKKS